MAKYLSQEHALLVAKRNKVVAAQKGEPLDGDILATVKAMDRVIGRLACVFNPKISRKAQEWLDKSAWAELAKL